MKIHRFEKRLKNISPTALKLIARIDELKGQWTSGATLSPQILGRLKQSILVTSSGASTRIEGARMSDADIEKMMRGISLERFRDRDRQEVQGYYELLKNIFEAWQKIKLTEGCIKSFHKELLKFVEKDASHRGRYKQRENKVHMVSDAGQSLGILFDTTPACLTPKEMLELVEWTNSVLLKQSHHPLLLIANFLVEFLKIHPFQDGNGRLSRILTNFLLLKAGYAFVPYVSHERIIEEHKADYYLALRRSQKTFGKNRENILPWLDFFLKTVLVQAEAALRLLSAENLQALLTEKQKMVWDYFEQYDAATPRELAQYTGIPRPTINQILNKLLRFKKIVRLGEGRGVRYQKS
jgi:Fic family protein